MPELDEDELEVLGAYERGELQSVATKSEFLKLKAAARATTIKDQRVKNVIVELGFNESKTENLYTAQTMPLIRPYQETDWPSVWPILHTMFLAGDTYSFAPDSTEAEIHKFWIELPAATLVACSPEGRILGTYFIKPNQPGLGSHVCNCGYVVAPEAQGQGIASAMCEHSQAEAVAMGFRAMQFNFVVSTNERAVRLWQKLGFAIVGRLPGAFRHQQLGFVDALVMFKQLVL